MTTAAFRLGGGLEVSSISRVVKQNPLAQLFVTKISKAFLDAVYAILDGLALLASDESPVMRGEGPDGGNAALDSLNPMGLLDLKDGVCRWFFVHYLVPTILMFLPLQDTRLLIVISNVNSLSKAVIPNMLTQFEEAFGTSLLEDRKVSAFCIPEHAQP